MKVVEEPRGSTKTKPSNKGTPYERLARTATDRGGALVDETFLGWDVKHTFRDSQGREWKALPTNILKGKWSPHERGHKSRDQWYLEIQAIARGQGGQLLEKEFKGHKVHHWFEDSDGNKFRARPSNIRRGQWSPFQTGGVKDPIALWDLFNELARRKGYTLLSEGYVNEDTELEFMDEQGRTFRRKPSLCRAGYWSPFEQNILRDKILYYQRLKEVARAKGGRILETEFLGTNTLHWFEDAAGRRFQRTAIDIVAGRWSPYEGGRVHEADVNLALLREITEERGGRLVSDTYVSATTKLEFADAAGRSFWATPHQVKQGKWSPHERMTNSGVEEIARQALEHLLGIDLPRQRPKWLKSPLSDASLELDGYDEKSKIAFEYQGDWHFRAVLSEEQFERTKVRDRFKREACAKRGIRLIEISGLPPYQRGRDGDYLELVRSQLLEQHPMLVLTVTHVSDHDFVIATKGLSRSHRQLKKLRDIAARHGGQVISNEYLGTNVPLVFETKDGDQFESEPTRIFSGYWPKNRPGSRERDWDKHMRLLRTYVRETGTSRVPYSFTTEDGTSLGKWVNKVRARYAKNELTQVKIDELQSIPEWIWRADDAWMKNFTEIQTHIRVHGWPDETATTKLGANMRKWIFSTRHRLKKGKVSEEQAVLLRSIDGLSIAPYEDQWDENFRALEVYAGQHRSCSLPPTVKRADGIPLATWVRKQRGKYKAGQMAEHRVRHLESLPGWSWDPHGDKWTRGLEALKIYVREFGTAAVPYAHRTADGFELGKWVIERRSEQRKGTLKPERLRTLAALRGWRWANER